MEGKTFAYKVTTGMPWIFRGGATNRWVFSEPKAGHTEIRLRGTVQLRPVVGWIMAPMAPKQMSGAFRQALDDLKYVVEHDEVHPRKAAEQKKRGEEQSWTPSRQV